MTGNEDQVARVSDEEAALRRHARFGELPPRTRPDDWVEETDTNPPAHELEQSIPIVQHPGQIYER
ncbi:MAG TPA: hypothetical protein VFM55_24780 [Micromonosporaceae bacterium]|nr:hypothetical protein [Micromonosporaceae bacterium]